jgi:hypothetical protein
MKNLQIQLDIERGYLATLDAFAAKYPETPGTAYVFNCSVNIDLKYSGEEHRNRVLAKIGETLGRNGWMKRQAGVAPCFNYRREIDGVTVNIEGAEGCDFSDKPIPVPPSAFPILLNDVPALVPSEA